MANPLVPQGVLNRLRCNVVVSNNPSLNVTPGYMGKSFARISFSGIFSNLEPTATGAVASPEPYVFATITMALLRTQPLSNAWQNQALAQCNIGPVTIYADTSTFQTISLDNCVIESIDPGPYDGSSPDVRVTLRGIYYINDALWSLSE